MPFVVYNRRDPWGEKRFRPGVIIPRPNHDPEFTGTQRQELGDAEIVSTPFPSLVRYQAKMECHKSNASANLSAA